jgi:hypothetical protein
MRPELFSGRAKVLPHRADINGGAAAPPYHAKHTDSRWIHLTGGCSENFLSFSRTAERLQ